jgi:phosphate:Na+ symporter
MLFIPQFAQIVRNISPTAEYLDGAARLAAETPRQIANAHTFFNVGNTLLFIWFNGPLSKLVDRIVPAREEPEGICPMFLDEMFLEHPALALDQVRRELVRLAELDQRMLELTLGVATSGTQRDIAKMRHAEEDVDTLHGAIITYLGKLSQKNLIEPQSTQLQQYIGVANYLENVGDVIENNVLIDAVKRMQLGITVSPSTVDVLRTVHEKVCWAFEQSIEALRTGDQIAARDAVESKTRVNELADKATSHLAKRLVAYEPNRLAAFKAETDILENLKRINTLTRRVARVVSTEVENAETLTDNRIMEPNEVSKH